MLDTVKNFKNHSREALLDLPQGTLDDYDLLQLAQIL